MQPPFYAAQEVTVAWTSREATATPQQYCSAGLPDRRGYKLPQRSLRRLAADMTGAVYVGTRHGGARSTRSIFATAVNVGCSA